MNCPECYRVVYVTQSKCACGAVLPVPKVEKGEAKSSVMPKVSREVREKESEINAFVSLHKQKTPGATTREACLEYMKLNVSRKGLAALLPKEIGIQFAKRGKSFDEAMDEYREQELQA